MPAGIHDDIDHVTAVDVELFGDSVEPIVAGVLFVVRDGAIVAITVVVISVVAIVELICLRNTERLVVVFDHAVEPIVVVHVEQ
jgi:hypothetical protein